MKDVLHAIGRTPLVPLARVTQGLGVPVLAKCEHLNPGGSVKDRTALAILDDAERRGVLRPGGTLIEATAGNTGIGLAIVAAARRYRVVCVMPEKMSVDKRVALETMGAQVITTPNRPPGDPENFQVVAARLAEEQGWFLTDQFRNPANVWAHETTTAPEILEQTGGDLAAVVAGAGTGGTITGIGRFFRARRAQSATVEIVLADPIGSVLAGWVTSGEIGRDGSYGVEGIGASQPPAILDRAVIDSAESVSDAESYAMCRRLIREEGLLVGGAAGTAVVAALRVASRARGPVVVILPDAWDRYRSCPWMCLP
jgi:cysteine synthase